MIGTGPSRITIQSVGTWIKCGGLQVSRGGTQTMKSRTDKTPEVIAPKRIIYDSGLAAGKCSVARGWFGAVWLDHLRHGVEGAGSQTSRELCCERKGDGMWTLQPNFLAPTRSSQNYVIGMSCLCNPAPLRET